MTRLKITFLIDTEADPSGVLDAAIEALPDLVSHVESYGDDASGDENDVCVEEVKA